MKKSFINCGDFLQPIEILSIYKTTFLRRNMVYGTVEANLFNEYKSVNEIRVPLSKIVYIS